MSHHWKHQYFEKSKSELHANIFRSLEIEQYLGQILKNNGFNLHNYKLNFSDFVINIFLSVHKTEPHFFEFKKSISITEKKLFLKKKREVKLKNVMKGNYLRRRSAKNPSSKLNYVRTLRAYEEHLSKLGSKKLLSLNSLSKKILESLNLFTHNRFNINLTVQEINFISSDSNSKQALLSFRKFEKTPFFKEGRSLLVPLIKQHNSAKLLGAFVASQLETIKRHNFFFNFLQESLTLIVFQKPSKVHGIKILISGRLNNAARSRNKIVKIGKISLLKIDSIIDSSKSTAFTSNGTFGIKVWICKKN